MADEKGKGKSKAGSDAASPSGSGGGSAAQTLASTLRSSLAASQLSSVMAGASGGKAEFQPSGGSGELRDWLVQDLRSAPSTGAGSSARVGGAFRTQTGHGADEAQGMFEDFERGMALNPPPVQDGRVERGEEPWQGGYQGSTATQALGSYTDLDGPLHASVRNDHATTTRPPPFARTQPPLTARLAATDDVFALLDEEERSAPIAQPPTEDLSAEVLSNFDPLYRAPSPSHASFTREQAQMHLSLAEEQQSSQGRQDLVVPRPDNADRQEGVYAPTAEAALASIFDATGRAESSTTKEEQDSERGAQVVRRITTYFAASSYLDDVYGSAPVLRETIEVVQKEEGEKRQRAVERLEKLWQHLSNTAPNDERGAAWVDGWLANNT